MARLSRKAQELILLKKLEYSVRKWFTADDGTVEGLKQDVECVTKMHNLLKKLTKLNAESSKYPRKQPKSRRTGKCTSR